VVDVRRLPVGEDNEIAVTLDDLAREGARRMIAMALEAEVDEYVDRFAGERGEDGKRLVVRNGRARERRVTVGSGTVAVRAPRVNDKRVDEETGERKRFSSRILPAYARRSPKVNDVLPVLYLRGLSTGDFRPALEQLLGEDAAGLCRRRSAACARTGRPSTSASAPACCASTATRTCSSTASTSRCAWARTTASACWS
jgi:transposase-like protein